MNKLGLLIISILVLVSCGKNEDDGSNYIIDSTSEMAQQVGDSMASMDESGGSTSGTLTELYISGQQKTFVRLNNSEKLSPINALARISDQNLSNLFISKADAGTACNTIAFSACSSGQRIRTLNACAIVNDTGTISGTISLAYSGTGVGNCTMPLSNDYVVRVPNFTITGLRGATYAVSAVSTGQQVKRTGANAFTFSNTGIRRKFTSGGGTVLLDVTTNTSAPIGITGDARNTRTIGGGGNLIVTDNLTFNTCTLTPLSVQWTASCNCPTSGSWTGSCGDGKALAIAFTNTCGAVQVTHGADVKLLTMDRCQ